MALKSPDMESCSPKVLCLGGVNDGLAYDPNDPCSGGLAFDPITCDCKAYLPETGGYWRWTGVIATTPVPSNSHSSVVLNSGDCRFDGTGPISLNCTTTWKYLSANRIPGWRGEDSGAHDSEPNKWYPLNGRGYTVKTSLCTGGWNVGLARTAIIEGDYDPDYDYTTSWIFGWVIDGSGGACVAGNSPGTTTSYNGVWQFSPNGSDDNITRVYDSPYTPQDL